MNDSNIEAKAFSLQEAPHQQKKRNHIKTQARECQRSDAGARWIEPL